MRSTLCKKEFRVIFGLIVSSLHQKTARESERRKYFKDETFRRIPCALVIAVFLFSRGRLELAKKILHS